MNDVQGAGGEGPSQGGWTPPSAVPPQPGWAPPAGASPASQWASRPGPAMYAGGQTVPQLPPGADWAFKDRKIAAGICGIIFGSLGVHKFILGYIKEGVIMALVTVGSFMAFFVSMFIPAIVGAAGSDTATGASLVAIFVIWGIAWLLMMAMYIIGLIEGIIYLTKSDYDFVMRYNAQHRGWF